MQFKSYAIAATGLSLLVLVLTLTSAGQVVAQNVKPLLVQIANSVTNPVPVRDVDNPARRAFQKHLCTGFGCSESDFTVPSSDRLVIEFISGSCVTSVGTVPGMTLSTAVAGVTADHYIESSHPVQISRFAELVRIYADTGSEVRLRQSANELATCVATISGYLVSL